MIWCTQTEKESDISGLCKYLQFWTIFLFINIYDIYSIRKEQIESKIYFEKKRPVLVDVPFKYIESYIF